MTRQQKERGPKVVITKLSPLPLLTQLFGQTRGPRRVDYKQLKNAIDTAAPPPQRGASRGVQQFRTKLRAMRDAMKVTVAMVSKEKRGHRLATYGS